MRFATFRREGAAGRVGAVVSDDLIVDLAAVAPDEPAFRSMLALIDAGSAGATAARHAADAGSSAPDGLLALDQVTLMAPIPRPRRNVFCVGLNYPSHVEQNARALGIRAEIGEVPLFFTKPTTAVVGPGDSIRLDSRLTSKLDYEVELAIVIGHGGTWIEPDEALDHVFGFTVLNDVSARDLQWRTTQMFIGKGLDTFCPMGPWIVDREESGPEPVFEISCRVNGDERQRDTTSNMIFGVREIVAELSKGITLEPGDVIATGTPGGCGYQMAPPMYLSPGDEVECAAAGIGSLANRVVEWPTARAWETAAERSTETAP
jgi:2-keto-4-pentenoate hydratase/2-oxohepta-3-ene-1,7-dioic acid hydratase in catechol pathway